MKSVFILTCKDKTEATKISNTLVSKKLAVCCKILNSTSLFFWDSKVDSADEVLVLIDSKDELFDSVEDEIAKTHSYDTFVLIALPILKVSKKAEKWWEETLN